MTKLRAGDADSGPSDAPETTDAGACASSPGATPPADVNLDPGGSPVPLTVVRTAGEARDPRIKGIVLSRLFGHALEPQRIGRFTLLDRLGEGGMGVVYAAYDDRLDRKVAVKVLRAAGNDATTTRQQRLLQEARALARLSHPNIVTVHEVGTHDDGVFVAMEHVRGQSLDRWLEGPDGAGGRPWPQVIEVMTAAGRGLAAAHRAGIVHRDFKPHNVIVGEDGVVKVLDFGLARMLGPSPAVAIGAMPTPQSNAVLTRTGATLGTPAYMAPEQHVGAVVDERSDQFAFFVTLYQALYRQMPFPTDSLARLSAALADGHVPTPAGSAVPRWLQRAVQVGLSIDRARRYPSMEAALAAIARDPAARRWRALGLGGIVVAAAAGSAAVVAAWSPPASVPCEHGAAAMAETWGPQAQAEVRQGLLASGAPSADDTWSRLEPRLEAHAEQWASTRDQACRAHREGATSAVLYDHQVACLELRLASFAALVELLGDADRAAAERALSAAAALPATSSCLGAAALSDAVAPPADPELAREVKARRLRLARVGELEALGRYAEGLQEARAVVEEAEQLGYRPLLAEALVREGSLAMEHAAPEDAERMLTAGLGHALATDHVHVAVEATARRIFVRAERMRSPERAVDDVVLGASLLERVGDHPRLRSLYLNNVGAYHIRRVEPEQARRVLEQALEIESQLGPDEPSLAQTMGNLSLAEEQAGRDVQAREHIEDALVIARRVFGPHHPTVAELAQLRGELLFYTGHLRAAETALQEVLETLPQAVGPHSPLHHAPLVLLGELALEERRYPQAQVWFERAAALALGGEMYGVLEQTGLARAWWGQGEAERARAVLERVVARAAASEAPYTAALRLLYGRTLLQHGHPEAALSELHRAIEIEEQQGNPRSQIAGIGFIARGRALGRVGRSSEAEAALTEALSRLDGVSPRRYRAWAHVERSLVASAQEQRAPAITHARAAVALLESWGEPEHPDHARAWVTLARALRTGTPTADELHEAEALAARAHASLVARGEAFGAELAALDRGGEM